MKFKLLIVLLVGMSCSNIYGQSNSEKRSFEDRIFVGGTLGAQFGNVTLVEISPLVGYKITEKFSSGLGATYIYYRVKGNTSYPTYETHIYGGRIFSQYQIIESILGYTEFEVLNLDVQDPNTYELKRDNVYSWLVGGAYIQPIGNRSSLNIYLLWDLIEDLNSPYQNPIVRIGINAGL